MDKTSVIQPIQAEFNLAILNGEEISLPTDDLYIPPNALKIFLESFEGPLDLLLQLAQTKKLDITKISILELVDQYLTFIKKAKEKGISKAIEGIQDFNKSSVKEIIKGLINNA